jgi:hypothetical protein
VFDHVPTFAEFILIFSLPKQQSVHRGSDAKKSVQHDAQHKTNGARLQKRQLKEIRDQKSDEYSPSHVHHCQVQKTVRVYPFFRRPKDVLVATQTRTHCFSFKSIFLFMVEKTNQKNIILFVLNFHLKKWA